MLPQYQLSTILVFLCCLCLFLAADGQDDELDSDVISVTQHVHDSRKGTVGLIRSHHDASITSSPCSSVIMLGVGTSMTVRDYDKISTHIAEGSSIVVLIVDFNEFHFQKTSPQKYALLVNAISNNISSLVPVCKDREPLLLIGGHSSSGEAAIMALNGGLLEFDPDGWVGLDPYNMSPEVIGNNVHMEIPSINWGFTKETCLVATDKAARTAYELADPHSRVLYAIQNDEKDCKITHCVFSDNGCGIICPLTEENDWVLTDVAWSIHLFVDAVANRIPFDRSHFQMEKETKIKLYVNEEQVE